MYLRNLLGLALTVGLPTCLSNPIVPRASGEAPVRNLLQLSPGTWLENLVQRPNGSFLLTELTGPNIWEVNPYATNTNSSAKIIVEVPGVTSLLGITEIKPDVYAFIAGNITVGANAGVVPGSWSVWSIDLSGKASMSPNVSQIARIPSAELLNGMDYVPQAHSVLIADSILSVIYKLDLTNGQSTVAINDTTLMKKCAEPLGVNGLKYHKQTSSVYWTNSLCGTLAQTKIDPKTALPTANSTLVADAHTFLDDFDLDRDGTAYVAAGVDNQILKITPDGLVAVVAGNLNSSAIAEPAAVRIGHSKKDHRKGKQTLYVSTAGALQGPINGTTVIGGQMVAIDLGS